MRLGMIVRLETDRGLGVQTFDAWKAMAPDATLVVIDPASEGTCRNVADYGPYSHVTMLKKGRLDRAAVRAFVDECDVIYSVETVYDDEVINYARSTGKRTIIHGNAEFFQAQRAQPTRWWWPTAWMPVRLPRGPRVPVPAPELEYPVHVADDGPLRLLHVVGRKALMDRNGTEIFLRALALVKRPVEARLCAFELDPDTTRLLEDVIRTNPKVSIELTPRLDDAAAMYHNVDLLVLPRKYGGLCLPALEASAAGLGVMMSDCVPNSEYAIERFPGRFTGQAHTSAGRVPLFCAFPDALAARVDTLSLNPGRVADLRAHARELASRRSWAALGPLWRAELAAVEGVAP